MTRGRAPSALVWGFGLVATACAAGGARIPGAIGLPANAAVAAPVSDPLADAFEWSPDRMLTWADFKGPPDLGSVAAALTAYVMSYDTGCEGSTFRATVVSKFLPRASWVKSAHLLERQSAMTLRHEQAHFDLSEVQARRARAALQQLPDPCLLADAEFDAMFKRFGREDADLQTQYDRDTAHGTHAAQQRLWESRIAAWLGQKVGK